MARALRRQLRTQDGVKWRFVSRATVNDAQRMLHHYQSEGGPRTSLVVLHVGTADMLQGVQPEAVSCAIRETVAPYAPNLVICSVPEASAGGGDSIMRAVLLNAELKSLCASIDAAFMNGSAITQGEQALARDGTHYRAETARQVAGQLVNLAQHFLGAKQGTPAKRKNQRLMEQAKPEHGLTPAPPSTESQGGLRHTAPGALGENHTPLVFRTAYPTQQTSAPWTQLHSRDGTPLPVPPAHLAPFAPVSAPGPMWSDPRSWGKMPMQSVQQHQCQIPVQLPISLANQMETAGPGPGLYCLVAEMVRHHMAQLWTRPAQ